MITMLSQVATRAAGREVFGTASSWPPSLAGNPLLAMAVTMAFWVCLLLCLQWTYAIVDHSHDRKAPWTHPLTLTRLTKVLLLAVLLLVSAPRVALLTVWHVMSPAWREWCSMTSWTIYMPAAVLFSIAWWLDRRGRRVEEFQLARTKAPPVDLSLHTEQKWRPVLVLALVLMVAFATTYIRKAPEHHAPSRAVTGR